MIRRINPTGRLSHFARRKFFIFFFFFPPTHIPCGFETLDSGVQSGGAKVAIPEPNEFIDSI